MDDQRFGAVIRAIRVKRRMTQQDLASAAGVSASTVSRIERGLLDTLSMRSIRAVAKVLDVRVELQPRSRGAELERVVSSAHAALAEAVVAWLGGFAGWTVRPEIGFSIYGERGVIDLVCWHPGRRALLVIELKTEIVDINELLGTLNRYVRHAAAAVAPMGWRPLTSSKLLIVGDSEVNRRRVADHVALFGAALPDRFMTVRAWLRDPAGELGELAGLMFFSNRHPGTINPRLVTVRRVRGPQRHAQPASARVPEHELATATRRPLP